MQRLLSVAVLLQYSRSCQAVARDYPPRCDNGDRVRDSPDRCGWRWMSRPLNRVGHCAAMQCPRPCACSAASTRSTASRHNRASACRSLATSIQPASTARRSTSSTSATRSRRRGQVSAWGSTRSFGILRRRRWCSKATSCCRSIRATCWSSPTACATPAARSSRAAVGAKTSAWPKAATAKAPSTGVSCATPCRANAAGPTRSWPPAYSVPRARPATWRRSTARSNKRRRRRSIS